MSDDKNNQAPVKGKKQRRVFSRYEHFKCAKLGLKWRRPRGLHSKVRQGRKGKPPQVNIGYGHPRATRGLVNGYAPAYVNNVEDLRDCAKSVKAVIIASGVGLRTVGDIAKEAEKLGVKILNGRKIQAANHRVYMIEKQRAERIKAKTEVKPEAKPAEKKMEERKSELAKTEAKTETKPEVKMPNEEAKRAIAEAVVKGVKASKREIKAIAPKENA